MPAPKRPTLTMPSEEFEQPEEKPIAPSAPAVKPTAKQPVTRLQIVCEAIAAFRKNDNYVQVNTADFVQYRNSAKRLVVNVDKLAEKDVARRDSNSLTKAEALLAAYKDFTEANVLAARQVDNFFAVVTTDGEKFKYDLTANKLA